MNKNVSYNSINNIRAKLLLFIDKEIRTNKIKLLKVIPKACPEFSPRIQFEETFYQNIKDEIHFSLEYNHQNSISFCKSPKKNIENYQHTITNNNTIQKFKTNQNNKTGVFHSNFYLKKNIEKNNTTYLKPNNSKNYNLASSTIINLKGKVYIFKSARKIANVIKISDKSEKGEKYLKKLCNSLKIIKPRERNKKKAAVCFYTNPSLKYKKGGTSTVKQVDDINIIKSKVNKTKTFHGKSIIKDNSNTNNKNISLK